MHRRAWLATLLALPLGACHGQAGPPGDGGPDVVGSDGPSTDVPAPLALDFAVTGCLSYDVGAAACAGPPPLTLTFSPVSSTALTRFLWAFGDGTPASAERAPTHTYVLPGSYDVSLVAGGAAGTVSRTRLQFVQISRLPTGEPCDVDGQCAVGLRCLCGSDAPCGAAFPRGVCTIACPANGCGAGAVCAALDVPPASEPDAGAPSDGGLADADASADAPRADASEPDAGVDTPDADASDVPATSDAPSDARASDAPATFDAPADAPAAFDAVSASDAAAASDGPDATATPDAAPSTFTRTPVCLASCAVDGDCAAGLVCRALPAPAGAARWVLSCVPPFFRDLGATCRDATGALDDDACASGTCADLGALGLCSASCAAGAACPANGACATFGDGQSLCVRACSPTFACATDPLLSCAGAGGAGPLGFQVATTTTTTATYCAPRPCSAAADCAPSGTCAPLDAGGHCSAGASP